MFNKGKQPNRTRRRTRPDAVPIVPATGSQEHWRSTRHGAVSARGFHYQDLVGTWLCCGLISNALKAERVVPEHLEDLTCEGGTEWRIQVKSRQVHVGLFSKNYVANLLLDLHERNKESPGKPPVMLVLELSVRGLTAGEFGAPLRGCPGGQAVIDEANKVAGDKNRRPLNNAFASTVSIFVLPQSEARSQIRERLSDTFKIQPAVAEHVAHRLRQELVDCVDANASAKIDVADRHGMNRVQITRSVKRSLSTIDIQSLEVALHDGICEIPDFDTPLTGDEFYLGVDAQPGHIAAGLTTLRSSETSAALTAVELGSAALLTGPSGVGKSTAMWQAANQSRHVLWYRVNVLRAGNVESIASLARSAMADERNPVGFLIDGVGTSSGPAWDELRARLSPMPFVYLIGTCRSEDLVTIDSLSECRVIEVDLDEATASRIFDQLTALGSAVVPHWRESYELSGHLTLEFTYLLTQGRRIQEVITDQVRRRFKEGRKNEVSILSLVTTAHQWGARISLSEVQKQLLLDDYDFSAALQRLTDEHLILVDDDELAGLHQLRSKVLSAAVHASPPPTIAQTVGQLVGILAPDQLQGMVTAMLIDRDDLDETALSALVEHNLSREDPATFIGTLGALRLVEFYRQAMEWNAILIAEGVAPAWRSTCIQLSMVDSTDLPFRPEISAAVNRIQAHPDPGPTLRSDLIDRLGPGWAARVLASSNSLDKVSDLLDVLTGLEDPLTPWLSAHAPEIAALFVGQSVIAVADVLGTARRVSIECAEGLRDIAGSHQEIVARLISSDTWITGVEEREVDEQLVAWARTTNPSDDLFPDPHDYVVQLARTAMRLMPRTERADVQLHCPDGRPSAAGGLEFGVTGLLRHYDHTDREVRWNRLRAAIASACWRTDGTYRAIVADAVLTDSLTYLDLLSRLFVQNRFRPNDVASLVSLAKSINEQSDSLPSTVSVTDLIRPTANPPAGATAENDEIGTLGNDEFHTLANGLVTNLTEGLVDEHLNPARVMYFIDKSLQTAIPAIRSREPWQLADLDPNARLDRIEAMLGDLQAVLTAINLGLLDRDGVAMSTRGRHYSRALECAAAAARRSLEASDSKFITDLGDALTVAGLMVSIFSRPALMPTVLEWPSLDTCIGIECAGVIDLEDKFSKVAEVLSARDWHDAVEPSVVIVPTFGGRPFEMLTREWCRELRPLSRGFPDWASSFPNPVEPTLADLFIVVTDGIRSASAALVASKLRDGPDELQSFVDERLLKVTEAIKVMQSIPEDPAIEFILGSVDNLVADLKLEAASKNIEPSFSAQVARGVRGEVNDDWIHFNECFILVVQWDIDPGAAIALLEMETQAGPLCNELKNQ